MLFVETSWMIIYIDPHSHALPEDLRHRDSPSTLSAVPSIFHGRLFLSSLLFPPAAPLPCEYRRKLPWPWYIGAWKVGCRPSISIRAVRGACQTHTRLLCPSPIFSFRKSDVSSLALSLSLCDPWCWHLALFSSHNATSRKPGPVSQIWVSLAFWSFESFWGI